MVTLALPNRTKKPREYGITAVHDVGVSIGELHDILVDYGDFIDIAKFGIGTAFVTPRLREKLDLYREFNVIPYFGGTLFEKFYYSGRLDDYLIFLKNANVNWIEISTGTIDIPLETRLEIVAHLKKDFVVVGEVGCKDVEKIMPPSQWIREMRLLLEAGCRYVITEGRDSGTAGVYRPSGELRTGLVSDISSTLPPERIIYEAPHPRAQMFFINLIGPNVNLGNVSPRDLLQLETQRLGLRNETFFLGEPREIGGYSTSANRLEP